MKKLSFPSYGVLTGDCTFDNVYVTGSRLFCNGYRTIFTENGQDPFKRNALRRRLQNNGSQHLCGDCGKRFYQPVLF